MDLIDPHQAPALRYVDIIIESHECLVPGVTNELENRISGYPLHH